MKLYMNAKARGWDRKVLEPMVVAAYNKVKAHPECYSTSTFEEEAGSTERIVLHLKYHPNDILR